MERSGFLLLVVGLLASSAPAEVVVRVTGERVDIDATAAPLADVLDRLAKQTGMEIVYEGARPRQRVTLALQGRSPAEAVQGILEGQGLNYALVADPTGARVQTLLLAGPVGKGTTPTARASTPPRIRRPVMPPGAGPDMMDPDFADLEEDDPFEDDFEDEDPDLEEPGSDDLLPPQEEMPGAGAPPPGAGVLPFPGGQPQIYPASPFTPQPFVAPPEAPPPTAPREAPPQ